MVEHGTENAGVDSSSLSLGTSSPFLSIGSFGFVSFARLRLAILLGQSHSTHMAIASISHGKATIPGAGSNLVVCLSVYLRQAYPMSRKSLSVCLLISDSADASAEEKTS